MQEKYTGMLLKDEHISIPKKIITAFLKNDLQVAPLAQTRLSRHNRDGQV